MEVVMQEFKIVIGVNDDVTEEQALVDVVVFTPVVRQAMMLRNDGFAHLLPEETSLVRDVDKTINPMRTIKLDVHVPENIVEQAACHGVWLRRVTDPEPAWVDEYEFHGSTSQLVAFLEDVYGLEHDNAVETVRELNR